MEGQGGSSHPPGGPDDGQAHQDDSGHTEVGLQQMSCHDVIHYSIILRAAKCKLLKSWHNLDVKVARYHFESCDNAKFLGAMEKYVHAIYLEVN